MSMQHGAAQVGTVAVGDKFVDMSVGGKILFVCKLVAFICTFGFAFPTLLND